MRQSWGPGLLLLGAVILIEGEPPVSEWVGGGMVGVQGPPSAQQPLQLGVCEEDCLWGVSPPVVIQPCLAVSGDVCVCVCVRKGVMFLGWRSLSAGLSVLCVFPVPLSAPLPPARP